MARIAILVVIALVIYLLLRRFLSGSKKPTGPQASAPSRDTVQCLQCKIYVPRDEAVIQNNQAFCCKQHARDWTPSDR